MKEGKGARKSFLVEVAPLAKSPATPILSYFSSVKIAPGTFVKVPLRRGTALGVAIKSRDARDAKTEIRRAGFLLKKIRSADVLEAGLSAETLGALKETARYYALPLGVLLHALLPKMFEDEPETFFGFPLGKRRKTFEHAPETLLLQMESEERFGQYRALVREAFARGSSCLLVAPTHLEIEKIRRELSRGIEDFVFVFSLSGRKKEMRENWQKALAEKHPVLFITTPAGMLFPRADVDTVIMERENSRAYRTFVRPYIHHKTFVENLCRQTERRLILGDSVLSLETLLREKSGEFGENSLIRWRLSAAPTRLVDAKSKQDKGGHFEIFSTELKELMEKALADGQPGNPGRILLFGARKGLAPTTVCGDCGFVLPCLNCAAPVTLHRKHDANVYICHACGSRRESSTMCGYCKSWKLVPLGIGTEEIARQAHALFPKTKVFILDKDHAPTESAAGKIARKFNEEGGILVATELAFFHLESVPYSAVVSTDALFSVPDFGIHERIFYLVSRLRELTKIESLVQTRNIGKQVLAWSTGGAISDLYQNEIAEREELLYPPFALFIKISALTKNAGAKLAKLKEELASFGPDVFGHSLIVRLRRKEWPEERLLAALSLLGPEFSIKVDPESIL